MRAGGYVRARVVLCCVVCARALCCVVLCSAYVCVRARCVVLLLCVCVCVCVRARACAYLRVSAMRAPRPCAQTPSDAPSRPSSAGAQEKGQDLPTDPAQTLGRVA